MNLLSRRNTIVSILQKAQMRYKGEKWLTEWRSILLQLWRSSMLFPELVWHRSSCPRTLLISLFVSPPNGNLDHGNQVCLAQRGCQWMSDGWNWTGEFKAPDQPLPPGLPGSPSRILSAQGSCTHPMSTVTSRESLLGRNPYLKYPPYSSSLVLNHLVV